MDAVAAVVVLERAAGLELEQPASSAATVATAAPDFARFVTSAPPAPAPGIMYLSPASQGSRNPAPAGSECRRDLLGARITIEALVALGPLRHDVDLDSATDILWTPKDPAWWIALVTDRGWPADRYEMWLARAMQQTLIPPGTPPAT